MSERGTKLGHVAPIKHDADDIKYDNTSSGLTATDVQAAIDELNSSAASLVIQNGDVTVVSTATTLDFSSSFTVTESPTGEANIALAGSGATIIVQRNDSNVDTATGTIDFSTQFAVSSSPAGEANVSISAITSAEVSDFNTAVDARIFSFKTIDCPSGTDPVADSNADTLVLTAGSGISITGDSTADSVTFANTGALTGFVTIDCPNGTDPVADSATDTLTFTSSGGTITITGDSTSDTVNFEASAATPSYGRTFLLMGA